MRLIDANLLVARLKENMRNKLESGIALDRLHGAIDGLLAEMVEGCPTADTSYEAWHDLRKDPDDLPEFENTVLICYDWGDFTYRYITSTYSRVWNFLTQKYMNDLKKWDLPQYWSQKDVIAWKAIERFDKNE